MRVREHQEREASRASIWDIPTELASHPLPCFSLTAALGRTYCNSHFVMMKTDYKRVTESPKLTWLWLTKAKIPGQEVGLQFPWLLSCTRADSQNTLGPETHGKYTDPHTRRGPSGDQRGSFRSRLRGTQKPVPRWNGIALTTEKGRNKGQLSEDHIIRRAQGLERAHCFHHQISRLTARHRYRRLSRNTCHTSEKFQCHKRGWQHPWLWGAMLWQGVRTSFGTCNRRASWRREASVRTPLTDISCLPLWLLHWNL